VSSEELDGRGLGRRGSWTEIDGCESNSGLNDPEAVKTFAFSRSGNVGRIRLLQTGLNHCGENDLILSAFELFGAVASLLDGFVKVCVPVVPAFPFTWATLNGVISYLTMKRGGKVHDRGRVEITASNISCTNCPRNAADLGTYSDFWSEHEPGQWICLDFKTLKIEPMHYTIRSFDLKSWAVEGSDDGASWTKID
jgi:hypothetical protein